MDDAGGNLDGGEVREGGVEAREGVDEVGAAEDAGVEVEVERADAGGDVDEAGELPGAEGLLERMDPEAEVEVELQRAVLDEEVLVAVGAEDHLRRPAGAAIEGEEDGGFESDVGRGWRNVGAFDISGRGEQRGGKGRELGRGEGLEEAVLGVLHGFSMGEGEALELDGVAGLELAELPELGLDDGGGADEAAKRRAIRAEQDGHVAGEVDGADGVGVVVDVRGVQAGLAAVGAGPLGLGAGEANASAV